MEWKDFEPKSIALKVSVKKLIEDVITSSESLVNVPDSLLSAHEEIQKTEYDIVVCGEVKKGKTSFINAMIGEELLPINTKVATSQVFRIQNSNEKHFYLVFTDGTKKEISREELNRYGSQIAADAAGEPVFSDKVLDYIQLQYPIAFLPEGVNIVDTPGLGAIIEAHERITTTYIKKASAVVFVTDPTAPLTQRERDFIERIYSVTPYVLFVMTKRDNFDSETVSNQIERDEELLNKAFRAKSFEEIVVNPVSNVALLKSSQQENAILKKSFEVKSKFGTVREKLLLTIYRAVGLSRCQYAYVESCKQASSVLNFLSDKRKTLTQNMANVNELMQRRRQMAQDFERLWGAESSNMLEIGKAIRDAEDGIKSKVNYLFTFQHPVYTKFQDRINNLSNIDAAKSLGSSLNDELSRDVLAEWNAIMREGNDKIAMKLAQFDTEMRDNIIEDAGIMLPETVKIKGMSGMEVFNTYRGAFLSVALVGGIFGLAAASIVGLVATLFFGKRMFREAQLKRAVSQLNSTLNNSFNSLRTKLTIQPGNDGVHTQLQQTLLGIDGNAKKAMKSIYDKHRESILKQLAQLEEQAKKSDEEKQREMPKLVVQENTWKGIRDQIVVADKQIKEIMSDLGLANQ